MFRLALVDHKTGLVGYSSNATTPGACGLGTSPSTYYKYRIRYSWPALYLGACSLLPYVLGNVFKVGSYTLGLGIVSSQVGNALQMDRRPHSA